jgi:ABC-type multidrug transport system fused ATPase/permease subunit
MFLRSLIGAIGGFIVIFSMSWKLTLIMLAVLPFAGVGTFIYNSPYNIIIIVITFFDQVRGSTADLSKQFQLSSKIK